MLRKMIMPTLGLDMEGAVIQKWLKIEGSSVARDEPVVLVETDKATTEITAPATGLLKEILQPEGTTVPVTHAIAVIETDEPGEATEEPSIQPNGQEVAEQLPRAASSSAAVPLHPPETATVRASPAARRMAKELGVALSQLKGTGPAGRVQSDDVRRFAAQRMGHPQEAPVATPEGETSTPTVDAGLPGRLLPLSRKRRITAERMSLSARTVARLTMTMEVDAGEMIRLRSRLLPAYEAQGVRL
ncbi:MAG: biotin/lipoyl-containing protein, partial [Chloroflexota bacterium]